MEKQLKLYLKFLEVDKKAPNNTLQSYKRDLVQFENYLRENDIKYNKATEQDIKNYIDYLTQNGKKPRTISNVVNFVDVPTFKVFEFTKPSVHNLILPPPVLPYNLDILVSPIYALPST